MTVISKLPHGKGFSFDLRPAQPDRLAYYAACEGFGKHVVDAVIKRYHRSHMDYNSLISDLYQYERKHVPASRDKSYFMAMQSIIEDLRTEQKLKPYCMKDIPNLEEFPGPKSAGMPFKNMGLTSKKSVIEAGYLPEIDSVWSEIGAGKHKVLPDVCLFARAQVCKNEVHKLRAVWGYPIHVYLEEARFFYPIMEYLKKHEHNFHIAYGLEMANGGMSAINDMISRHKNLPVLCTDWKQFDKSIPPWLIRDAFYILSTLIDFGHLQDINNNVFKTRESMARRRWKKLIDYFINTPVITTKGERYLVTAGVPSGSCFTNIIDTIINCLITRYCAFETTGFFPLEEVYLGDDAVVILNGYADVLNIAELALAKFGMILNVDKTVLTTNPRNVYFLGYYNFEGIPYKPQDTIIASFINPEHTRRTAEECGAAALGQLYTTFCPKMAFRWYKVLITIGKAFEVSGEDIVMELKNTSYRHRYLRHIGRDVKRITIPNPGDDSLVLDVLPRSQCSVQLKSTNHNYHKLWEDTLTWHRNANFEITI